MADMPAAAALAAAAAAPRRTLVSGSLTTSSVGSAWELALSSMAWVQASGRA